MSYYKTLESKIENNIFKWQSYLADSSVNSRTWHIIEKNTIFEIVYDLCGTISVHRRPLKYQQTSANQEIFVGKDTLENCQHAVDLIADNLIDYLS